MILGREHFRQSKHMGRNPTPSQQNGMMCPMAEWGLEGRLVGDAAGKQRWVPIA